MILLLSIIIILLIIIIVILFDKNDNNYKYIPVMKNDEDRDVFINNLKKYLNDLMIKLNKINIKINIENYESTDFNSILKWYIKKCNEVYSIINDELSEKIKNTKYFKKYKTDIIELLDYIYTYNISFSRKNNIGEYYEIFIEKLNNDLNCCATIWNINLFFEKIIKNFHVKN